MRATSIEKRVKSAGEKQPQQRELAKTAAPKSQTTALRRETNRDRTANRTPKRKVPSTSVPVRVDPQQATEPKPHFPAKRSATQRPSTGWIRAFIDSQPLEKSFITFGFVVASTLILIIGSDLIIGWPFQRASTAFDITNVICGLGLAYLSWDAYRDLV